MSTTPDGSRAEAELPDTEAQRLVQAAIDRQVAEGRQIGVQVAAYHSGRLVVSAVAGTLGPDDPRPVQPDTLFCSFSVTKGVASLAAHQLADAGLLDFDAPVAKYWPEFAQHGKDRLTVAQALSHQGGLHALPDPFELSHLTDWDAGIARIADGVPAYEPGTDTAYHAVTFAWLVGGIVAGASKRHIAEIIATDIAAPLGMSEEMFVGLPNPLPAGMAERLATLAIAAAGQGLPISPEHDFFKAMPITIWPHFNELAVRQACLPSANGHFTARALAKMYASVASPEGVDDLRLLSLAQIVKASERIETEAIDQVMMSPVRKGVGFFHGGDIANNPSLMGPRTTAFGHPGAGGPVAFADPEVELAVAVTSNKMQFLLPGQGPTDEICDLIRQTLGVA